MSMSAIEDALAEVGRGLASPEITSARTEAFLHHQSQKNVPWPHTSGKSAVTEQTNEAPANEAPTPAPTIVVDGTKATVVDARGRTFIVQKLTALDLYRLTKALGDASTNVATSDLAALAAAVRSIDGNPVAAPRTERDIEFVIGVLDFDGLAAVGEGLKQLAGTDTVATAKN